MASKPKFIKQKENESSKQIPITKSLNTDDINSKFEVELCWCIQQLELVLSENKLNPAKAKDSLKALNILRNNAQPIIKKRQIMNLTFGDYRAKMAQEEERLSKVNQRIKFVSKPNKNSVFVKKSTQLTSANEFKFNFPAENEDSSKGESKIIEENTISNSIKEIPSKDFKFEPSSNTFRFNFNDTE